MTGTFETPYNNYKIIVGPNIIGTLVLGDDPLHLVRPEVDDPLIGLRTLEAEITVKSTTSLEQLYSDDIFSTPVIILAENDSSVVFLGFLEPATYSQPIVPGKLNEIQLVAVDICGALMSWYFSTENTLPAVITAQSLLTTITAKMSEIFGSYWGQLLNSANVPLDAYFNTETFIGSESVAYKNSKAEEVTYGEMLKDYCRARGVVLMSECKNLKLVDPTLPTKVNTEKVTNQLEGGISMEVLPPARSIDMTFSEPLSSMCEMESGSAPLMRAREAPLECWFYDKGTWDMVAKPADWENVPVAGMLRYGDYSESEENATEPSSLVAMPYSVSRRTHAIPRRADKKLYVKASMHFTENVSDSLHKPYKGLSYAGVNYLNHLFLVEPNFTDISTAYTIAPTSARVDTKESEATDEYVSVIYEFDLPDKVWDTYLGRMSFYVKSIATYTETEEDDRNGDRETQWYTDAYVKSIEYCDIDGTGYNESEDLREICKNSALLSRVDFGTKLHTVYKGMGEIAPAGDTHLTSDAISTLKTIRSSVRYIYEAEVKGKMLLDSHRAEMSIPARAILGGMSSAYIMSYDVNVIDDTIKIKLLK